jgi:hypothetical protein
LPTLTSNPEDEILQRADALFRAEQSKDLRGVIAEKIQELQHYDVLGMDRVVAIVMWGRSGTLLLASYLDGHEDVITLPLLCGTDFYKFFEQHRSLPWRDKLLCYPAHAQHFAPFFEGDFAISPAQYYAAVQAIGEFYADLPPEFLESRRAFFLLAHIAYNLALGRRPASSRPLIVYQQHFWDHMMAGDLVKDFPQAKFLHAVRDPITLSGKLLSDSLLFYESVADPDESRSVAVNPVPAVSARPVSTFQKLRAVMNRRNFRVLTPINGDRPQFGMESRTLAIRFEDLHCDLAETMRGLSTLLGLSYQPTLLESTFNGIPWVVKRDGIAWSGRRPEQALRNLKDLSPTDRVLLFALFYENCVSWDYPCPKIFRSSTVRWIAFVTLFAIPTKLEFSAAWALLKSRIAPSLRHGNILVALKTLFRIVLVRLAIMSLVTLEFVGRSAKGKILLEIGPGRYSNSGAAH